VLNSVEASAVFVLAVTLYAAGPLTAPRPAPAPSSRPRPSWARGPITATRYTRTHTRRHR